MRKCSFFKHLSIVVILICSKSTDIVNHNKISRAPASYILNDDIIVTPVNVESNFIEKLNEKHAESFDRHRKVVENWQRNEELAKIYGLENRGVFQTTTLEQRQRFLQRNYLRFITKEVEMDANQGMQNIWQQWNDDDEYESIKNVSLQEVKIASTKKEQGLPGFSRSKTVNEGKDRIKFGFRPYLEMGMFKVSMDTNYFKAKGWLGVNGNQEVNVEKYIKLSQTKFMYNYYIEQQRSLAIIDQKVTDKISLRYTHRKTFEDFGTITSSGINENNIFQIRFGMGF